MNNINKIIFWIYNVSNDNNTKDIYLKLGKKGPNTLMCFYTNSCHRERSRTPSLLLTQSVYQQ